MEEKSDLLWLSDASTEEKEAVGRLEDLTILLFNEENQKDSRKDLQLDLEIEFWIIAMEGRNIKTLTLINEVYFCFHHVPIQ